ncbi:hypothetical protein KR018_007684, partial [Drosophila ironensis]
IADFNLQEEASIPEDIFDQHDGDIEDGDPRLQYPSDLPPPRTRSMRPLAPIPPVAPFAAPFAPSVPATADQEQADEQPVEDDEDDDEEDKEIEREKLRARIRQMQMEREGLTEEEDEDASEAADIILESQRPTSRNFSAYLDAKKYENNNANKRGKDKEPPKPKDKARNYKLKNNKERVGPEDPAAPGGKSGKADGGGFATKYASENFGRQSLAYTKLKGMHEQPEQARNPKEPGQEQDQLFDSIEILNERKLNKPLGGEPGKAGEMAIGDIEDNLDNDEELESDRDRDRDQEEPIESDEIGFKSSAIDNDELAKRYYPPTTTMAPTTLPTTTPPPKPSPTTTMATARTTTARTTVPLAATTARTQYQQQPTIGRKLKRHGNAFGPKRTQQQQQQQSVEDRFYEIGRIKEHKQGEEQEQDNVGELHFYDPNKSEENYVNAMRAKANATEKKPKTAATRFLDDEYAEHQPPALGEDNERWDNQAAEKPEADGEAEPEAAEGQDETSTRQEDGKLESDLESDSGQQRYPQQQGSTATALPTPSSAFERFKALRRSRQKIGHKTHKKRYKDYLRWQQPSAVATPSPRHLQKLQQEKEMEKEKEKAKESGKPHSSPIFSLGMRPGKPFYEGQVSYFDNSQNVDQGLGQDQPVMEEHHTEMERLIAHDNGQWYRRISPVLRNGVKSAGVEMKHHHQGHHRGHQRGGHHHSQEHHNHHLQKHHHHHQHQQQHQNHKTANNNQLIRSRPGNPYQRKPPQKPAALEPMATPTPPLPPPKPELGHQITELEHLERYYAKWPHLARVQFQVYDEHYRESHPELYGDYEDDDYESAAELEEAQQERGEEANLPPYIKKYNRRNKQLLNLLEGTLPSPTNSPGPGGEPPPPHVDDEYLKEKRRRYHQHHFEDLFAQQKSTTEATRDVNGNRESGLQDATATTPFSNQLPENSAEGSAPPQQQAVEFWPGNKVQIVASSSTPKPALFKLPSYPAIAGSFLGTPRSRSRSAQFVANVAGRGQSSWFQNATGGNGEESGGGGGGAAGPAAYPPRGAPSPLNSFVYHRVMDGMGDGKAGPDASDPAGGGGSRKQSRLPFVAITDRRLESLAGKRTLAERHKDFEQNHFPMP